MSMIARTQIARAHFFGIGLERQEPEIDLFHRLGSKDKSSRGNVRSLSTHLAFNSLGYWGEEQNSAIVIFI